MPHYEKLCDEILEHVGGKSNISFATHCLTRLRMNIKDRSLVDSEAIKKIDGVLGCLYSGGQLQIIIGQNVDQVYQQFSYLIGLLPTKSNLPLHEEGKEKSDKKREKFSVKSIPNIVIDIVSGCVTPILPIITATGIIKLITALLGKNMFNILPETSDLIVLMTFVGDAGFYFFPIFVAWAASKKFNTSTPIALFLGAVLIHPTLLLIVQKGADFSVYGIPMQLVNYASQFLPSIIIIWVMSHVYRFFDRRSPKPLKIILVPTGTILVMLPLALCIVGPLGNLLGRELALLFTVVHQIVGPLAIGIIGSLWYFLVATGMHQALIALAITEIGLNGADSIILVGAKASTYALMGLCIAFAIRCKKENKAMAYSNAVTLLVGGISEPTIFSVLLKYKKAIIIQLISGMVGGILTGIFAVKVYFFGATNILTGLAFGPDVVLGMCACGVSLSLSLILGAIFGFEDSPSIPKSKNKAK